MSAKTADLFGIPNCDTVRKARKWLEKQEIAYDFHDVREQPLQLPQLQAWAKQVGWTTLFNKRSTSYRNLDKATQANLDEASALALILEQPTLMKRPVFQQGGEIIVGFNEKLYQPITGA